MRRRVEVLLVLVVARLLINVCFLNANGQGQFLFESINISRKSSNCIINQGKYWVEGENICKLFPGGDYLVIGTQRASVIDRVLGRIWLDRPRITLVQTSVAKASVSFGGLVKLTSKWQEYLAKITSKYITEPESALVLGVVLGYKGNLSTDFYQALVKSGTIHMVVASGYNVMIVASLVLSVALLFVGRRMATFLALGVLTFYVLLTGAELSILRAFVMGIFVLVGPMLGRKTKGWWSLLLACFILFMIQPLVLLSISFQLSVAATFGVVVLSPHLEKRLSQSGMVLNSLLEKVDLYTTISAILITAPIIWWHFGSGSVIAIYSNSLILPLVPILMALGAMLISAALIVPWVAGLVAIPTYSVAHLIVVLVNYFAQI